MNSEVIFHICETANKWFFSPWFDWAVPADSHMGPVLEHFPCLLREARWLLKDPNVRMFFGVSTLVFLINISLPFSPAQKPNEKQTSLCSYLPSFQLVHHSADSGVYNVNHTRLSHFVWWAEVTSDILKEGGQNTDFRQTKWVGLWWIERKKLEHKLLNMVGRSLLRLEVSRSETFSCWPNFDLISKCIHSVCDQLAHMCSKSPMTNGIHNRTPSPHINGCSKQGNFWKMLWKGISTVSNAMTFCSGKQSVLSLRQWLSTNLITISESWNLLNQIKRVMKSP